MRETLSSSPRSAKKRLASSRPITSQLKTLFSARIFDISFLICSRSSGVKGRSTRKSYWNFSEWSVRPTSIWADGNRRLTASAITCSAEWRITPAASGSRAVTISRLASSRSGMRRSTSRPSTRPASAARARPLPICSATARIVEPAGTSSILPSGKRTWISLMIAGGSCEGVLLRFDSFW